MRLIARSTIYVLAMAGSLGLVACGGGGDDDQPPIEGTAHTYVVDTVTVPTEAANPDPAIDEFGFDLDGDGTTDNQLGNILSALVSAAGSGSLDIQAGVDTSVDDGSILLLANITATSLSSAAGAGFSIYLGTNPSPAPCTDVADPTTCRQHLDGNGTFDIDTTQDAQGTVAGNIVGGTFTNSVPGTLALQISFQGSPVNLTLVDAHAQVTGITDGQFGASKLGGGVPDSNIQNDVIPAVQAAVAGIIADDCGQPTGVGDCMCLDGSTGNTLIGIFDDNDDCQVPLDEFRANTLIMTLLRPDVDTDGDGELDALSVGVQATGVAGAFTVPGA
jgi:hypothetical protein